MRAGLSLHLCVPPATGHGEWAPNCLPRALPHAAELHAPSGGETGVPRTEEGIYREMMCLGLAIPKEGTIQGGVTQRQSAIFKYPQSNEGSAIPGEAVGTQQDQHGWVIHVSFSQSPRMVQCAHWKTSRSTRNALSSFHSFRPLARSSVAVPSPAGPDQHRQCGVTAWSHSPLAHWQSITASLGPCEEHREGARSTRPDRSAQPEVLAVLVLHQAWGAAGERLVSTACQLLVP